MMALVVRLVFDELMAQWIRNRSPNLGIAVSSPAEENLILLFVLMFYSYNNIYLFNIYLIQLLYRKENFQLYNR